MDPTSLPRLLARRFAPAFLAPPRRLARRAGCVVGLLAWLAAGQPSVAATPAARADLTAATVVVPTGLSGPEHKAVTMLVEEVAKRSYVQWPVSEGRAAGAPRIYVGPRAALVQSFAELGALLPADHAAKAEGYEIVTNGDRVVVAGNDARGVLFGVGRLLRALDYARGEVALPGPLHLRAAPRYPIRGDQFSYRPKTNSYDGWTVADWEQYLRDIVVFGANAIEIIPPRSDDAADSPHFNLPPMAMMIQLSRLAQEYGIELWVWYPAMDPNYADPAQVQFALKEWDGVLRQLPQLDAIFVPGGDPGHTPPKVLFPMLEQQAAQLRRHHPHAQVWMSPQGFDAEWMNDFYGLLQAGPAWLNGIVFGPQQRESVEELRRRVPARYPLRFYPDITHTLNCQYPVPDWDYAFQVTLNREPINPRPLDEAAIFHHVQPYCAAGVIAYCEGCNDDVNKCVWNSLAWDPDADVHEILREYSRYFIGDNLAEGFADGLLALELNWRGPLATNAGVDVTLQQFQAMERDATPAQLRNWRFQQALYRAYYDATVRARLIAETAQERAAESALRQAATIGVDQALSRAEQCLAAPAVPPAAALRARTFELAEALFQSIHMQLSVPRYHALAVGRGANLDLIDTPLNDAPWLRQQLAAIQALPSTQEQASAIDSLLNWENPGPGGFYDDLGNSAAEPHLVRGVAYRDDPGFLRSPLLGTAFGGGVRRISSRTYAQSLFDQPLEMEYRGLDPAAHYRVRIIYGTGAMGSRDHPMMVRLVANGKYEIHGLRPKDPAGRPVEFDIPPAATRGGDLRLTWTRPPGLGGNGQGVQVAEVWLIRAAN